MILHQHIYNLPKKLIINSFSFLIFSIIFITHKFKLMLFLLLTIFLLSMFNDSIISTNFFYYLKWIILFTFVLFEFLIVKFNKLTFKFDGIDYKFFIILFSIFALFFSFFSINIKISLFKSITFILLILFSLIIIPEFTKCYKKKIGVLKIFKNIMLVLIILNTVVFILSTQWAYKTFIARFQGVFSNPNTLGMFLFVSLPVFVYFFLSSNKKLEKIVNFIFILLIFMLAIFTFSRAALLGMLIFMMVILFYLKKRLFKIIFLTSIVLLVILFSSPTLMELLRLSEDPFTYRDRIWQIGLESFSESKIIGKGYGTTQQIMSNKFILKKYDVSKYHLGKHFHNIYVEILCETGLIGIILFSLFIIFTIHKFVRLIKTSQNEKKIFAISVYSLFIGVIVHGFFESMLLSAGNISNLIVWCLIGMGLQKNNN